MRLHPFALIAVFCPSLAVAIEAETLVPVVVTDLSNTGEIANGSSQISRDDLLRSGQRELSQVLRGTPGLTLNQGMKGGIAGLSLRGASGGMGLVRIDGIPLHDTIPGGLGLDLLPAETFNSADIRRGSAAIRHFGRALGGVLDLHSRDSRENDAGLHLEGGSFGSLRESVSLDWASADHSLNLNAARDDLFDGTHWADDKKGNSERDDFHAHQLALHLRNRFSERVELDSSVYYINGDSGVDKVGLLNFTPEFGIVDDPARLKQEIWLVQSKISAELLPHWRSELQLGHTQHRGGGVVGDILPSLPRFLVAFDARLSLARWKNSHRFWLDNQQERGLQFSWGGEGLYEQGHSISLGNGGQRGTGSGFADLQLDWDAWQASLAVRADHFDDVGAHAVYHAGLSWQINKHWQWYANAGTGYRPPSFNEMLMWPFGNPQLRPESSVGGESGLRWQPSANTSVSANYFHNHYDDLIKVLRMARPLGLSQIHNIPHAQVQGLEIQWRSRWNQQWQTGIDYTWTDATNLDTGKPLPQQPQHTARFWNEWSAQTLPVTLWTQGIYRGNSFQTEGAAEIGDSFQLDMQLSYQVNKPLNLYVGGENLTDNRQSQNISWGMPGAAVYGGLKLLIDF
jgi:outer membrane cobalamin receptor